MVAFLLEHRQTIGMGLLAVWALMQFGGSLGGFVARLRSMVPGVGVALPGATATVGVDPAPVIRQLNKRFANNPEVKAALKTVWTALLEDAGS